MKTNSFGEPIFGSNDLISLCMQGYDLSSMRHVMVDDTVDLTLAASILENVPLFVQSSDNNTETLEQFDRRHQHNWHMPDEYKQLDIAEYVLSLCKSEAELQRVGHELLLYQDRNLFDLLKYLKYLVDVMRKNNLIWGVGRGSSVASYVLYLLEVHRINSMYYNLDVEEFLR